MTDHTKPVDGMDERFGFAADAVPDDELFEVECKECESDLSRCCCDAACLVCGEDANHCHCNNNGLNQTKLDVLTPRGEINLQGRRARSQGVGIHHNPFRDERLPLEESKHLWWRAGWGERDMAITIAQEEGK